MEQIVHQVRADGGKVTPQRMTIYQLLQGDESHPTADAIYEKVHALLPTVSRATVYKTLNELVGYGDLKRFDVGGVAHYDPDTRPHGETVCLSCGRIRDVEMPVPEPAAQLHDFHAMNVALTFFGHCSECYRSVDSRRRERRIHG
jgi:Fe2+ or Zn2+ uptake regulation protein